MTKKKKEKQPPLPKNKKRYVSLFWFSKITIKNAQEFMF